MTLLRRRVRFAVHRKRKYGDGAAAGRQRRAFDGGCAGGDDEAAGRVELEHAQIDVEHDAARLQPLAPLAV